MLIKMETMCVFSLLILITAWCPHSLGCDTNSSHFGDDFSYMTENLSEWSREDVVVCCIRQALGSPYWRFSTLGLAHRLLKEPKGGQCEFIPQSAGVGKLSLLASALDNSRAGHERGGQRKSTAQRK